ncbi:formate dehydrogenase subunit gamma [Ramlibacter sp. PS4R-6]|uniref:formate dehydrogenase subunit gamma n=1 Tax=Ramlibacter sp. PS4R-6 TaxID=3133438 RepID=UPI003094B610
MSGVRSSLVAAFAVLACAFAFAQAPAPKHDEPPPAPGMGGIKGQNILEVKPEVKPDASSDPKYMQQSNGERNRVQPGNNAPMYRDIARGVEGFTNYPKDQYPEMGVLIQPPVAYPGTKYVTAGEAWRQVRNNYIIPYGGALVLITLVALGIFYFTRGPIGHAPAVGGGGQLIERFTPFERAAHWTNAIAFCVLGISGIVMAFGKFFLLPVMGRQLFGPLTYLLKTLHNFFGPLFAVSLVIVIITFIKDEFPRRGDLNWLLKLGGIFSKSGDEPPTHRFNAGEKVVFWIAVVALGLVVVASGLVLDKLVPSMDYLRATMQTAHMVHAVAAVFMICLIGFHIYLGTVGVRGAYTAMRHGWVDEAWAHEHHGYWYEDLRDGKVPVQRSQPAGPSTPAETARPA